MTNEHNVPAHLLPVSQATTLTHALHFMERLEADLRNYVQHNGQEDHAIEMLVNGCVLQEVILLVRSLRDVVKQGHDKQAEHFAITPDLLVLIGARLAAHGHTPGDVGVSLSDPDPNGMHETLARSFMEFPKDHPGDQPEGYHARPNSYGVEPDSNVCQNGFRHLRGGDDE